jgi:hypothetical protein
MVICVLLSSRFKACRRIRGFERSFGWGPWSTFDDSPTREIQFHRGVTSCRVPLLRLCSAVRISSFHLLTIIHSSFKQRWLTNKNHSKSCLAGLKAKVSLCALRAFAMKVEAVMMLFKSVSIAKHYDSGKMRNMFKSIFSCACTLPLRIREGVQHAHDAQRFFLTLAT